MSFRAGLVGLVGAGLFVASSSNVFGEQSLKESADKLYREVERRGRGVYFNVGDVHYAALNTSSNMLVHSMVLNEGFGFEKIANYDFEEGKLDYAEVIIYDKKKGRSVLEKGTKDIIQGLFHKMLELLNVK